MSRRFSGSTSNYLRINNLNAARGSTSNVSIVFNVQILENVAAGSIFGMHDGSNGIGIRLNTGSTAGKTLIQLNDNASGRSPAEQQMVGIPCFVAIVNDVGANECRFYFGYSASTMVSLGSAGTALSFSGSAMPDAFLGLRNANGSPNEPFIGSLDKFAIFYDTVLTLPQIKSVAACGTTMASSATRYYTMDTGATDETDHSPNNDPATENGTVLEFRTLCSLGDGASRARAFDGVDDTLDTGLNASRGSTSEQSGYAWVIINDEALTGEIYGLDQTQRLRWLPQLGNSGSDISLTFFGTASGAGWTRVCSTNLGVDVRGIPLFLGWVNDVTNNRFRYFWGLTPDTVIEVPAIDFVGASTSQTFDQVTDSAKLHIGGVPAGHNFSRFFRGTIDTVGLEFDTLLTLADMKERAACGQNAGTHYWEIDGTSPESNGATVNGSPAAIEGICTAPAVAVGLQGYLIIMM